jgi:hypothetical protein
MSIVDFVIDTICLAVSPDRPEWMIPLLGWKFFKQVVNAVSQPFKSAGNAIGSIFGRAAPSISVVGGTSAAQQAANDQALKALQAQLAETQAAAARAEQKRIRDAAIAAEDASAANLQNASIKRASDTLSSLNTAQIAADASAGNRYSLAMQGIGNVGGGFDINAARLQALSNIGGAGGGSLAGATPYMAPSNVAPAVAAAAINQESGGRNARSNRFNIPSQNLTYGGG